MLIIVITILCNIVICKEKLIKNVFGQFDDHGSWFTASKMLGISQVFGVIKVSSGLVWRCWEREAGGEGVDAPCPVPIFCPKYLFYLAIPELYHFTINQWSRN